jgi:hypothetical protein
LFNSYFVESVEKLADQISGTHATYNMTNLKINTCPQTIFYLIEHAFYSLDEYYQFH